MPTNDERREVAVKLRDMACRTNPSWPALMDLLKCPGRAVAVQYLADLIEPEERTCRNIANKTDREFGNPFICSECGADPHDAESYHCSNGPTPSTTGSRSRRRWTGSTSARA